MRQRRVGRNARDYGRERPSERKTTKARENEREAGARERESVCVRVAELV